MNRKLSVFIGIVIIVILLEMQIVIANILWTPEIERTCLKMLTSIEWGRFGTIGLLLFWATIAIGFIIGLLYAKLYASERRKDKEEQKETI